MLLELRIRNLAVIESASVRLEPGLNVLTGETGAGKSIIVGALALLLGERASSDVVRPGTERATVEGVFDVAGVPAVLELLAEQGLESEEGLLILRREVAVEGRNRAWVNGSASTASLLGELGSLLVDLHGQHEHQTLLRGDEQRAILDRYGEAEEEARVVREAHGQLRRADAALEELERRRSEVEERAQLLRHQAEEIEGARLSPGEDGELTAEARRLEHAEELGRLAEELHQGLYAAEESVSSRLAGLRRTLERLLEIDGSLADAMEPLDSAYYAAEEVGRRLGAYAAGVEGDPARLDAVRRRLDLLFRLQRKYGGTVEEVLEKGREARAELDLVDRAAFERRALQKERAAAAQAFTAAAARLTELRSGAARRLQEMVSEALEGLGMPGARFEVALPPSDPPGAEGAEGVEFRVSVNPGFEPRPLSRVASGGELSRVMLALKSILADQDRIPSLVFDEIDAGIGGQVGHRVGERLREVARGHQVFVITHLAQIAARSDHHLLVEKLERDGSTVTRVAALGAEARVAELARMMGADPAAAAGLEHARELLQSARTGVP